MTRLAWALIGGFLAAVLLGGACYYAGEQVIRQEWKASEAQIKADSSARVAAVEAQEIPLVSAQALANEKSHAQAETSLQEIPDVTRTFKPTPLAAPEPLPDYHFTVAAVCVWDTDDQIPVPGTQPGADGRPDCAHTPDAQSLSDVTPADALSVHAINADAFNRCRATLTALQQFVRDAEGNNIGHDTN